MAGRPSVDAAPSSTPHVEVADRFAIIPEELLYDAEIPAEAVRVYGVLLRYGSDPTNCYPSHATIAAHIGKSARSVPAWIRTLELAGWIERVARVSPEGDPTSNGYRVFGRAGERGVRAGERVPLPADVRGGSALDSAPKESQVNDSQGEGQQTLLAAPASAPALRDRFDDFWSVYPRKVGKGQALPAWKRAMGKVDGCDEVIIAGAVRYRDDPNRDESFTKHPSTWLNGECWNDPLLPPRGGTPTTARMKRIASRPDGLRRLAEAAGYNVDDPSDPLALPPGATP